MRGVISSLLVIISVVDRELFIPDLVPDPTGKVPNPVPYPHPDTDPV